MPANSVMDLADATQPAPKSFGATQSRCCLSTAGKVLAVVGLVYASVPAMANDDWHPAANNAETALAEALAVFETDDAAGFVALFPERFPEQHSQSLPNLQEVLTPSLIASIRQAETRLLDKWCGGRYREDDQCGMNYNPVLCAQDWPREPLFRTKIANSDEAIVEHGGVDFYGKPELIGTYHLVKRSGRFLIDGIACQVSERFNWTEKP